MTHNGMPLLTNTGSANEDLKSSSEMTRVWYASSLTLMASGYALVDIQSSYVSQLHT